MSNFFDVKISLCKISWFLPNLYILCLTYTQLHILKLKEIALVVLKVFVLENCLIFFTFFFFLRLLRTKLQIYLSCIKITFPYFDFFQIWITYNAYWGLHFPKILRNSKKIQGAMYYNITIFFAICRCTYQIHHQCYGSENFPNIVMLLNVDCFEGFLNRSKIDELVINNTIGCNYKNYKLNNNNYKLNNSLAWKQCYLILRTF